jgi:hypothetical protein
VVSASRILDEVNIHRVKILFFIGGARREKVLSGNLIKKNWGGIVGDGKFTSKSANLQGFFPEACRFTSKFAVPNDNPPPQIDEVGQLESYKTTIVRRNGGPADAPLASKMQTRQICLNLRNNFKVNSFNLWYKPVPFNLYPQKP